jgi:hypothetical protein
MAEELRKRPFGRNLFEAGSCLLIPHKAFNRYYPVYPKPWRPAQAPGEFFLGKLLAYHPNIAASRLEERYLGLRNGPGTQGYIAVGYLH